jgi:hypothetical protein
MSLDRLLQILWMMHVSIITTEDNNGAVKKQRKRMLCINETLWKLVSDLRSSGKRTRPETAEREGLNKAPHFSHRYDTKKQTQGPHYEQKVVGEGSHIRSV